MVLSTACMANLRDLTSISKIINEKSDEINRILADVENELVQLRIGVEAWLESEPLTTRRYQEFPNDRSDEKSDYLNETHLGYARHASGFALLVKEVRHVKTVDRFGNDTWEVEDEESPQPLRQASRTLRVNALDKLEALFDVIKKEAERTIQSIEKGKKAVEGLKRSEVSSEENNTALAPKRPSGLIAAAMEQNKNKK